MISTTNLLGSEPLTPGDAVAAIIIVEDGRYLLQSRDDIPGIFYPGHWGLFGGGVDEGESPEQALYREMMEELQLAAPSMSHFSKFEFDLSSMGGGKIYREFFKVEIRAEDIDDLVLGEGQEMRLFTAAELLSGLPMVPYDSFAIWLHRSNGRLRH
jgi:8-oxo-dGTP pyrophosphatase MutT (NUDIX family)